MIEGRKNEGEGGGRGKSSIMHSRRFCLASNDNDNSNNMIILKCIYIIKGDYN